MPVGVGLYCLFAVQVAISITQMMATVKHLVGETNC